MNKEVNYYFYIKLSASFKLTTVPSLCDMAIVPLIVNCYLVFVKSHTGQMVLHCIAYSHILVLLSYFACVGVLSVNIAFVNIEKSHCHSITREFIKKNPF